MVLPHFIQKPGGHRHHVDDIRTECGRKLHNEAAVLPIESVQSHEQGRQLLVSLALAPTPAGQQQEDRLWVPKPIYVTLAMSLTLLSLEGEAADLRLR